MRFEAILYEFAVVSNFPQIFKFFSQDTSFSNFPTFFDRCRFISMPNGSSVGCFFAISKNRERNGHFSRLSSLSEIKWPQVREAEFRKTDSTSVFAVPDLTILLRHSSIRQRCTEKFYPKLGCPCCIHFQNFEGSNRPTKSGRPGRTRAPIGTGDSSFCSHDNSLHSTCRHRGPISTRVRVIRISTLGCPFCILLP